MVENEELYGKVREAQTLSRKDSVKAKALETEVDHLKDEFDRLRALYVNTRDHVDNMEVGMETLGCVTKCCGILWINSLVFICASLSNTQ